MYQLINLIQVIQLYPRENVLKNTLLVLILVCVGFIGLSRLMSPQLFKIVNRDFWSRKFYNESFSDSDIISPAANFLLFLNDLKFRSSSSSKKSLLMYGPQQLLSKSAENPFSHPFSGKEG